MLAEEVEFFGENEWVEIVPNFSCQPLYLINGQCGPFKPNLKTKVPIWLAADWRRQQKCRVLPPDWLNVDVLSEALQHEKDSAHFTKMPNPHYIEIAHILLNHADISLDMPKADDVRLLIKDLWDLRLSKLRSSTDHFVNSGEIHAQLDNLTQMEINDVRSLVTQSLTTLHSMKKAEVGQATQ